jgi:hypothetical protein
MPIVAVVDHELPVAKETAAQIMSEAGRKKVGSSNSRP